MQAQLLILQALEQRGVSPDSSDLIKHNLVVFRDGEAALQVTLALLPEYHVASTALTQELTVT